MKGVSLSKPSRCMALQNTALLEPPRETGFSEADTTTTFRPSSAADTAVTSPAVPAPTTTRSASTVSAMESSAMGSGGISKAHSFWEVSAVWAPAPAEPSVALPPSVLAAPSLPSILGALGAQPARALPATMAPEASAPFKKERRPIALLVTSSPSCWLSQWSSCRH